METSVEDSCDEDYDDEDNEEDEDAEGLHYCQGKGNSMDYEMPLKRTRQHLKSPPTSATASPPAALDANLPAACTTTPLVRSSAYTNSLAAGTSMTVEANEGVNRLLWDSASIYSDSRPPSNFVVYNANEQTNRRNKNGSASARSDGPPLFDGSVANATPPPLGGISAGPSGGSGTVLHLACALDLPLALAFLLSMGADARSTHTAFRRLMIHEAACNGSIQCLTLLLELGRSCAHGGSGGDGQMDGKMASHNNVVLPDSARQVASAQLRFFADTSEYPRVRPTDFRPRGLFGATTVPTAPEKPKGDFLQFLRLFREYTSLVKHGFMTELDAARGVLAHANLSEPSRVSLAHSCTFEKGSIALSRGIFRPRGGGCADGHGNTPLHWAAFKNEVSCVSLLLKYNADPNARAHPSGWSALHDAAYSNSKESIALLVEAGAQVDARANSGATPLCFAAQEDAADAAMMLLERGADLATRCAGGPYLRSDNENGANHHHPHSRFSGYSPLHYCAHYNAHSAARVLLMHPAARKAMEISDLSDRLPIHVAVARGSSDVLRELLHAGARVETPQAGRRRAAEYAQSRPNSFQSAEGEAPATPQQEPRQQGPGQGQEPATPTQGTPNSDDSAGSNTPVSSPVLRAMIPAQPITSSKPWNCLSQRSIDECRRLISHAERNWTPERHLLFTPADRRAVMELLRVGKRLEQKGTGIFIDLWPLVLSFCGRGWFETEADIKTEDEDDMNICSVASLDYQRYEDEDHLMLPSLSR